MSTASPSVMNCTVIDYGSGNLRSAAKALERAANDADLSVTVSVTARPDAVAKADSIVLPGVGAFADCRAGLLALPGMRDALEQAVIERGRPFLGICVGMQLMAERGLEHGVHRGLGWIAGDVVALAPQDPTLKVPHMGWNELAFPDGPRHPVLASLPSNGAHVYFVHSYHLEARKVSEVIATSDHGGRFVAAVARDNLMGTQFHPEKSQALGLRLLGDFLRWRP